jgi:hypothetical protein
MHDFPIDRSEPQFSDGTGSDRTALDVMPYHPWNNSKGRRRLNDQEEAVGCDTGSDSEVALPCPAGGSRTCRAPRQIGFDPAHFCAVHFDNPNHRTVPRTVVLHERSPSPTAGCAEISEIAEWQLNDALKSIEKNEW